MIWFLPQTRRIQVWLLYAEIKSITKVKSITKLNLQLHNYLRKQVFVFAVIMRNFQRSNYCKFIFIK